MYRRVDVKVWRDGFVKPLTDQEKLLWLYLLTSSQTESPGIYTMSPDVAARDLNWSPEQFGERFGQLLIKGGERAVKWDPDNLIILLPNYLKYNPLSNPNLIRSWVRVIDSIPENCPLIPQWYSLTDRFIKQYHKRFLYLFRELFAKRFGEPLPPETGSGVTVGERDTRSRSSNRSRIRSDGNESNGINRRIWDLYVSKYETVKRSFPTKSEQFRRQDLPKLISAARHPAKIRGAEATDEQIEDLLGQIFDIYFKSTDEKIVRDDHSLGRCVLEFTPLLEKLRAQRKRRKGK